MKNHLPRKAKIYLKAFSHCTKAILLKPWLPGVEGAIMRETCVETIFIPSHD
jgi:hypothetical protein